MTEPTLTSGIDLLVDWANAQDHWIRALVTAVLQSRRALGIDVIEATYDLLLQEKGLVDHAGSVSVPALGRDYGPGPAEQPLRLTTLSDLTNVNALAPGQSVTFNPGMTVLYGENGAGKSGYVRVLKHLAAVRTKEPILPDISVPGPTDGPSGMIAYDLGGSMSTLAWTGQEGVAPFTRIDIFDAHGVDVHVDGELTYIYTPSDLAVFRHTHEAVEAVRARLDQARRDAQPAGNPFRNRFSRDGSLYVKIETLGPTTDLGELERHAAVSESDRSRLGPLQDRVNALTTGISDAKLRIARSEKQLLERVSTAIDTAAKFDEDAHRRALDAVENAQAAHTHETRQALAAEGIPGALEESWRRFVEAGDSYLREHYGDSYPHDGDTCPYCLQDLSATALQLLRKYQLFCRSELQGSLDSARKHLTELVGNLVALDVGALKADLESRMNGTGGSPAAHPSVVASRSALDTIAAVQATVRIGERLTAPAFRRALHDSRREIAARLEELREVVIDLREQVDRRQELLVTEASKLRELQDRNMLRELLPAIRRHVELTKWASRASTLLGRIRQVSRSLTNTTKIASEKLLNDDFERVFFTECKALRAPSVSLDFPGRKGQPARRKRLTPQHRLSAILSEGEQKVIALADFFAESTLRGSASPFVLDDPVTSLDYKRLKYVVNRLVEFSMARQVIVFTHNIWFTMELLGKFDDDRTACTYYDISEDGEVHGIVVPGQSPRLDTWNDKKKRINKLIGRIRAESDSEVQVILIEKGYDDLRGACEIVVEQTLLRGVVQSYRPNVMVGNLLRVNVANLPQASHTVNEIFDRCCRFTGAHRQPLETLSVRPTLVGLEEDWKALRDVRTNATN